MDSITLIRPVLVKVLVTEEYKKAAAAELQEAVRRLEAEITRLDLQEKRVLAGLKDKDPQEAAATGQRLEKERGRLAESRQKMLGRLKEIGQLPLGSEITYARMESPVDVKVGDSWNRIIGVEIVLKDGTVTAIRPGGGAAYEKS